MNRTYIPGFYFDEEKKKFFKIQADHLVPGTKYSKGSVKKENRKNKKRKLDKDKQAKRECHTVKRNPVLQDAITAGVGLYREHGTTDPFSGSEQQDAAIVSQFRPKSVITQLPGSATCPHINLTSAIYLPSTGQMVTASSHSHTGVSALHVCKWDWDTQKLEMPHGCGFAAFHSAITSVSVAANADLPRVVACSRQDASTGQIFISPIPPPGSEPIYPYQPPGIYFHVRSGEGNRLITSINPYTGITAVSTSKYVYVLNDDATMNTSLTHDNEQYRIGIDWLNPNTVAFEANSFDSGDHEIKLWDIRTAKGVVSRFRVRNRITGLLNPSRSATSNGTNGHQLLASTNHCINLYDTRIPHKSHHLHDLPMLAFPHIHPGPELEFAPDGRNLIAAVDRDNVVQIWSMLSGRKVSSLTAPKSKSMKPSSSSILQALQWYDDPEVGSALQVCMGNEVVRWTWGGSEDEEEG